MTGLLTLLVLLGLVALVVGAVRRGAAIRRLEQRVNALQSALDRLADARLPFEPSRAEPKPSPPVSEQPTSIWPKAAPATMEPIPASEATAEAAHAQGLDEDELPEPESAALADESGPSDEPPEPPYEPPPPPPPTPAHPRFEWERFIGLRLPVWLGAIALCVAGFFFVSYAIESGFFTPQMRVLAAAAAALAFLAGAEFVRRRVTTGNPAAIASALGAASIATAYATVFLATRIYDLAPSGTGFIATVGVSLLAIAIALAYGEVVAMVGIVGAYVAPIVYGGGEPNAPFLMLYVTAITAASYAIIRYKSWWRLSVLGLLGPGLWGLIWVFTPALLADAYWSDAFLLALPIIVTIASWPGWREDGAVVGLRGLTGAPTAERLSLIAAVMMAAIGFVLFLMASRGPFVPQPDGLFGVWPGYDIRLWQGLIVYGALAVALGFASSPHRALQLPILIATGVALLLWRTPEPLAAYVVIGATAIIFGFGALDQFRRLREPALWASLLAAIALYLFAIALFKVVGWQAAIPGKHWWALAALALAAAFVGLLRFYGPRVAADQERSVTYAAWGGAVTTLVSLAVVLEVDPLYFPAATAIAILGLAAVHLRVPVRGLRVVSVVYLVLYGLLLLGAFAYVGSYAPEYYPYVFAPDLEGHSLILLVLPGIALLVAATLFQRTAAETARLVSVLDLVGIAALALGLWYLLNPSRGIWPWADTYIAGGPIAAGELALALVAIFGGRRLGRPMAHDAGMVLALLAALGVLAAFLLPLLSFWPGFRVPGTVIFNVALLTLAVPAGLLFAVGWLLRQDARDNVRWIGIGLSTFAVLVSFTLVVVDIRQAWHLDPPVLSGPTSQSEFYAYSIATLLFGLGLLGIGLVFRHRGARALSFVFVLGATIKVFLFDVAELGGLWRVLSFLLMGLSFLGISWAYARFVFGIGVGKPAPPPGPPTGPPAA